ncbi:MAG: hypothetical protein ABI867_00560 [Kofleriaceae bacterium]
MSIDPRQKESAKKPEARKPSKQEAAEEALRDQAKTEVEERPYLDTEGGE